MDGLTMTMMISIFYYNTKQKDDNKKLSDCYILEAK